MIQIKLQINSFLGSCRLKKARKRGGGGQKKVMIRIFIKKSKSNLVPRKGLKDSKLRPLNV